MTSPPLSQEMPDGSRRYCHPLTGELVPSVTTIIAMLSKPLLTGWAARVAADYAIDEWDALAGLSPYERKRAIKYAHEREREKSADLGTAVHSAIDSWCKGEAHVHAKDVDPYMGSFTRFLMDKRPEFLYSEVTIWNRTYDYAGTADSILRLGDKIFLTDYKTGKNLHSEVGLQLSALAHGEFIITPDGEELELPVIDALAAIHIRPRSWHFTPVNYSEENFRAFLAARELYSWSTEIAEGVLAA